jgi:hypothetical protein
MIYSFISSTTDSPLLGLGRFFSFVILHIVDRTPWTGESARRKAAIYTQNKRTQTSMRRVGFEPTTAVFERAATAIGLVYDRGINVAGENINTIKSREAVRKSVLQ